MGVSIKGAEKQLAHEKTSEVLSLAQFFYRYLQTTLKSLKKKASETILLSFMNYWMSW